MKWLALLIFFSLPMFGQIAQGPVRIIPLTEPNQYSVAVQIADGQDADEAVVTIFYYTNLPGIGKVMLSKTSVVHPVREVGVASDAVPVNADHVAYVDVTLVKTVDKQRFTMNPQK